MHPMYRAGICMMSANKNLTGGSVRLITYVLVPSATSEIFISLTLYMFCISCVFMEPKLEG
jgi:hypothetical protein